MEKNRKIAQKRSLNSPTSQNKTSINTAITLKKIGEYEQSKPAQLNLFEMLLSHDREFSNTIELYDFIPKYFWGKSQRINGKFFEQLKREFECRAIRYRVKIDPAKISDHDGVTRDYYPSKREELVEDMLRKFACEGQGLFLDDQAGVTFTFYQIQQELKRLGHTYKHSGNQGCATERHHWRFDDRVKKKRLGVEGGKEQKATLARFCFCRRID